MKRGAVRLFGAVALVALAARFAAAADLVEWGPTVTLEGERRASWARLARLKGGDWLAGYAVFGDPGGTVIRVKRSADRMRSWAYVTEVREPGRQLDNAHLVQLADGDVLLAMRSLIPKRSYRVQVYRSRDGGRRFEFLSVIDGNEQPAGSESVGVWEPFLYQLADGTVVALYADETSSRGEPAYSQVISRRISRDGGRTWGPKTRAVAERGGGRARPGEPNAVRRPDGTYVMFYEVCGSEDCTGHYSTSADGLEWSGLTAATIPGVYQNPQGLCLPDGTLIVTSNSAKVAVSRDSGRTWEPNAPAFESSAWGALYQTGPGEVALVTGAGGRDGRLLIRLGKLTTAN